VNIEQTFFVARPPEEVFDYVTNPANLSRWQTSNRSIEPLTDGPAGVGSRFRERTKPPLGKEFEQITEFTEFDRPRRVQVHVVEGPYPVDGTWTFEPAGDGTRVAFIAEGELTGLMKLLEPVASRLLARQFAGYHRNLKQNIEHD
jgi:carbon monoxide dehydrogenase subunit G